MTSNSVCLCVYTNGMQCLRLERDRNVCACVCVFVSLNEDANAFKMQQCTTARKCNAHTQRNPIETIRFFFFVHFGYYFHYPIQFNSFWIAFQVTEATKSAIANEAKNLEYANCTCVNTYFWRELNVSGCHIFTNYQQQQQHQQNRKITNSHKRWKCLISSVGILRNSTQFRCRHNTPICQWFANFYRFLSM